MRSVQIPQDLLLDLVKYHCLGVRDAGLEERIAAGLEAKVDSMARRQEYAKKAQGKDSRG